MYKYVLIAIAAIGLMTFQAEAKLPECTKEAGRDFIKVLQCCNVNIKQKATQTDVVDCQKRCMYTANSALEKLQCWTQFGMAMARSNA